MNTDTLLAAMPNLEPDRAAQLLDGCNQALLRGGMTTVRRAAMFLAQIGEESGSLRYKQEIAPPRGALYPPYIGRTFIQITWESNYLAFGNWAGVGNTFVKYPEQLADDKWAWLGPVWYWGTHNLNGFADVGDVEGATRAINGGLNGYADRLARYQRCITLGPAILPVIPHTPDTVNIHPLIEEDDMPLVAFQYQVGQAIRVCDPLLQNSREFATPTDFANWKAAFRRAGGLVYNASFTGRQAAEIAKG